MNSRESFNSNAAEADGIHAEIGNPNPIVFPTRVYAIPKNQLGVSTPVELGTRIVNNTSTHFYLNPHQPFIPELLSSDGQIKQKLLVTDEPAVNTQLNRPLQHSEPRELERWKITPGLPRITSLTARLFWLNNLLRLQIPTGRISPNNYWLFDALAPGTYQLRFILNIDRETTPALESDTKEVTIAQETESELLATPWVNLRLVQPLSTDSSAIEVDGVEFKTDLRSPVLAIPRILSVTKIPVKLGIRVTNNRPNALRFEQLDSLDLNLIDEDNKEVRFASDIMRLWVGEGPKYYIVQPGENEIFVLDGTLSWYCYQLQLAIPNKAGGFYYFRELKPGKYQMRVIYHSSERRANYLKEKGIENVWSGWIAMPFVEFCLVEA